MSKKQEAVTEVAQDAAENSVVAKDLSYEQIKKEVKPLSKIGFLAAFQKLGRAWLGAWYGFADKHPTGARLLSQFVVMFVFSNLVTILQFLIMAFLPYAFEGLWSQALVFPAIEIPGLKDPAGNQLYYAIFNEPVQYNAAGEVIAGGMGNFIAFEIAVFVAQVVNFPLQRNITFKSNGNAAFQAMWYFIGWVLISIFVNAIWGIIQPFATAWEWNVYIPVLVQLLKAVITGGISMIIFFFIFLIIFPDMDKVAAKAQKKVEKLEAAKNIDPFKIIMAKHEAELKAEEARLAKTRKAKFKLGSQASSKALAYTMAIDRIEKNKREIANIEFMKERYSDYLTSKNIEKDSELAKKDYIVFNGQIWDCNKNIERITNSLERTKKNACQAIADKYNAFEEYEKAVTEVKAERVGRFEMPEDADIKGYKPLKEKEVAQLAEYEAI